MSSPSPTHMVPELSSEGYPSLEETFYREIVLSAPSALAMPMELNETDILDEEKVYTSLSDRKQSFASVPGSPESDRLPFAENIDIHSFRDRHPQHWTSRDITNWIYYVCSKTNKLDKFKIRGENFAQLCGEELCSMTQEEFLKLEPTYGDVLHDCFSNMLQHGGYFKAPVFIDIANFEERSHPESACMAESPLWSSANIAETDTDMDLISSSFMGNNLQLLEIGTQVSVQMIDNKAYPYDYHSDDGFADIPAEAACRESSGYGSDDSGYRSPKISGGYTTPPPAHINHPSSGTYDMAPYPTHPLPAHTQIPLPHPVLYEQCQAPEPPKQRGRPKKDGPSQRGRKQGQTTKGNHLWEFIRDTINDSRHNPDCIKWENKEQGIFKIVNSAEIARLWGKKKNNPNMTYEKFSRAMRFCRGQGHFADIPKNENYPKKLCFRFGDKATNWLHD